MPQTFDNLFQATRFFFDILSRKVFFCWSEFWWSTSTRFIIETFNTPLFPLLDPCSNCVSIDLRDLGHFFDLHPLFAAQKTMRTDPGSGGRIMFHDFC